MAQNQIQQKIFESTDFGEIRVFEQNGEAWFVGRDVCKAFGDKNSSRTLSRVDDEDKQIITITDSMGRTQNVTIINESGLYSVLFAMQPQKANHDGVSNAYPIEIQERIDKLKQFKHWVTSEVLPSIRKTGKYSARKVPSESTQARLINAKVRFARELQRLANIETVSTTYKQILIAQAAEALTGVPMELPRSEGKTYSAGEVGKMLGISAQKVGKLANDNGLKVDEFGAWYHDKSPYSSKEVDTFRYNEKGVAKLRELIGGADT